MSLEKNMSLATSSGELETLPAEPAAPAPVRSEPESYPLAWQSSVGNSLLAAAATSAPPRNTAEAFPLELGYGNAFVAHTLIQRKAEGDDVSGLAGATPESAASPSATQGAATSTITPTLELIVEDSVETLEPGQMKKSQFLRELRGAVCNTTAEALAGTAWSVAGCPYIDQVFAYYSTLDSKRLERSIRKYAAETAAVTTASGLIPIITARVRRSLTTWVTTGEVTGVPAGVPMSLPDAGMLGAVGGGVSGALSGIAGAGSGFASGVGSAMSGVSSLLFKERDGGTNQAGDPQAIQAQLGAGHSLDGGVRSRMELAFGESFSDVQVHADTTGAALSDSLNARAFTVGQHLAFGSGEYRPGTLVGDALIAHELAHVMQQRGGSAAEGAQKGTNGYGALEEEADETAVGAMVSVYGGAKQGLTKVGKKVSASLKSGLRLQRCGCSRSRPAPVVPARFSDLQRVWPTLTTAAQKEAALLPAIAASRTRASQLFRTAASDPILAIRRRIEAGIHVDVEDNPMIGVTQDNVEQAYRSWAEGAGVEPWILLALWAKEGIGKNISGGQLTNPADVSGTIAASTAENAKILYRSRTYYFRTGMDHFIYTTATSGDNAAIFTDASAAQHETAFRAGVAAQVAAGRLPRDISAEITGELTAAPASAGRFQVTPSNRFFSLSLLLAGAYYRENAAALAADPRIGANPDPGLVYMRWNMGATRFAPFLPSAEGHRMESQYTMSGGRQPSLTEWAFEREPQETEFGQSRRNAIRFRFFVEVFRLIYEGW